jgi:RNA polymerase sigma-70 factor (ECF subfamily)
VLATLIRLLGDFDLAEDARQDACAAALLQWPREGVPANPSAWLIEVGRRRAIDQRRRLARFDAGPDPDTLAAAEVKQEEPDEAAFGDDRLRLIFTCCHPALATEAQVALTLRAVCGLTTAEVARAFLVAEETMAQRLVRAKKKIREAGIPYAPPAPDRLDERLDGVLATIYLIFTAGYAPSAGADLVREALCVEAIRLGRLLDELLPARAEISGLLALLLLHDARRAARMGADGVPALLDDQDRSLWNCALIAEGAARVEAALNAPGRLSAYAVQAAIAALHAQAPDAASTDWPQITGLYEVLMRLQPTPVVELNHAVAVAMVDGPVRALALVDALTARTALNGYAPLSVVRADLLRRLGRYAEARIAYGRALKLTKLEPERRLLRRRLAALSTSGGEGATQTSARS